MSHRGKKADLVLCALPVETINWTLEMELEAGEVVLTRAGQVHAERRHPDDFARCLPHLTTIIADPLYIGDDFENQGIELIGKVHVLDSYLLIAVNVEVDENGRYQIFSFYEVSETKIASRRGKGFLKVAQKA